jgi:hypothetical protein
MEQQAIDREAIANEVWNDAEPSVVANSPEPRAEEKTVELPVESKQAEDDPWAGIPPALREEVEGLRTKVVGIDGLSDRLKQTERRLGGVLNELHAAKEAAKVVTNAPSKEQINQAATSQAEWDRIKEDWPEWAAATEGKIAAERADILSKLPDIEAIRQEIQTASSGEVAKIEARFVHTVMGFKHPKWQDTIKTPDFVQWHQQTGGRDSTDPIEVIAILDEYETYRSTRKSPKEINEERQRRLEASQTTPGHRLPPTKSEADMTEAELRAAIAKDVWRQ